MIANLMNRGREVAAYIASVLTTIFGSLSLNDLAVIVGIFCTVGTFAINAYYKRKDDKREEERHNKYMKT